MKNATVVRLGSVRDSLAILAKVRLAILAGEAVGLQTTIWDTDNGKTIYLAGTCREDPRRALLDTLKALVAAQEDDAEESEPETERPQFRSSQM